LVRKCHPEQFERMKNLEAPFAKYLLSYGGTRLMVARGVLGPDGQITKRWKARLHGAGSDIKTQIQGNG
jgi:hypothetical protein